MGSYEKILQVRLDLWENIIKHYVAQELFSVGWILLIGLTIVSYVVWLLLLDKKRLKEVLLVGALVSVGMGFLDVVATTMVLWSHKVRLIPGVPSLFATDYTLFPVMVMIAHQFSRSWKSYFLWAGGMSAVLAFVIFPIYISVGTMALNRLNYLYVFMIVYVIALVCRAIYSWVDKIENRNRC